MKHADTRVTVRSSHQEGQPRDLPNSSYKGDNLLFMVNISKPELIEEGPDVVVTASLTDIEPSGRLRIRLPAQYSPPPEAMADAMLPFGLLLAMSTNQTLTLEAPVSAKLLHNSETVQDIYQSWYPNKMHRATVQVPERSYRPIQKDNLTLSTFTGGVDAFYTLEKHSHQITSLLYVYGFDMPLHDKELRTQMSRHLNDAATHAGKTLIEGVSNIRRFLNPHLSWSKMSHGATISSIATLLTSHHDLFYFPSSYSYADQYPWGSHPLVDPLWSTEYLTIVHDGAGATRVQKTRRIAHNPSAQKHLRICFQRKGEYNCGQCSKCIRTKIALKLEGKLDLFETLDHEIDLAKLTHLRIRSKSDLIFAQENYEFSLKMGDSSISNTLKRMIDQYRTKSPQLNN